MALAAATTTLIALVCVNTADGQWAIARRNVNLRLDPSTTQDAVRLLPAGTELEILWPDRVSQYWYVTTALGEIGWVWSANVRLIPASQVGSLQFFPREPSPMPVYNRLIQYGDWIDEDRDCEDTRAEVLIRDSRLPVERHAHNQCRVRAGSWVDPFGGDTLALASDVDIDHMVPLRNAHLSGAWRWSFPRLRELPAGCEAPPRCP
jgi:hypothetical protein